MGITSGVEHFLQSIIEVIQGIFAAILHVFQLFINTVVGAGKGAINFVEGTLGFAIHNFFIIGTLVAAVLGYLLLQQRQAAAPVNRTVKTR